jgi:hypothetical protein
MVNRFKLLLAGTVLAVASGAAAAHGRVSFGVSVGVPIVAAPVYVAPPVVYYPPAPVYYAPRRVYYAPVYYAPPAVVVRYPRVYYPRRYW